MPDGLGRPPGGSLSPCPDSPNCVHTGMRHPEGTEQIYLSEDVESSELMAGLRGALEAMPRTVVVTQTVDYLHAESTSRLFRFVDDLELLVTPDRELVVRSASRVGRSDMGVNARRVDELRSALATAGLLRS